MKRSEPTIKGIFVNSHIKAVQRKCGQEGLWELEKRYGHPVQFRNFEDVPVREEVQIIKASLDLIYGKPVPKNEQDFESGRLHFRNFLTTPLAKIIFPIFRRKFKLTMIQAKNIAGHVFQGVQFSSEDLGPRGVKVIMENNDYPLDHFRGLFQEWLNFAGLKGTVEAKETTPNRYEYIMTWR